MSPEQMEEMTKQSNGSSTEETKKAEEKTIPPFDINRPFEAEYDKATKEIATFPENNLRWMLWLFICGPGAIEHILNHVSTSSEEGLHAQKVLVHYCLRNKEEAMQKLEERFLGQDSSGLEAALKALQDLKEAIEKL